MNYHKRQYEKVELRDTRHAPVKICQGSHRTHKSSSTPSRKPGVIYVRPPEVIYTRPQDFMALVQRLTGSSPTRSRYQENDVQNGAAVEVLRPSAPTPQSQSLTNSSVDERANNLSRLVEDTDKMEMSRKAANASENLRQELMGFDPPNTKTSFYAGDHRIPFHSANNIPSRLPNTMAYMVPSVYQLHCDPRATH